MPNQISFFSIDKEEKKINLDPNIGDKVKIGDYVQASIGKSLIEGTIASEYGPENETLNIDFLRNGTMFRTPIPRKHVKAILRTS